MNAFEKLLEKNINYHHVDVEVEEDMTQPDLNLTIHDILRDSVRGYNSPANYHSNDDIQELADDDMLDLTVFEDEFEARDFMESYRRHKSLDKARRDKKLSEDEVASRDSERSERDSDESPKTNETSSEQSEL